jgi:hypothetical protein
LLLIQGQAKAILNINIFDDGPNLKVTVQGSLSRLGTPQVIATFVNSGHLKGQLSGSGSFLCTGPNNFHPNYNVTGPVGFGGNGEIFPADSVSGFSFEFAPSTHYLPGMRIDSSYVLGQPFISSATFNGESLASQGFTATGLVGTWTIDGTSESFNVYIGPTATPGPLPLFGAAAAFGWSRRLRKRIAAPLSTPPQA